MPTNVKEIELLFKRVFEGNQGLDILTLDQLKKLQKGACKAITVAETQQITNERLLEVAKEEKNRNKRKKGKDYRIGRVIGIEVLEQRDKEARDRVISKV